MAGGDTTAAGRDDGGRADTVTEAHPVIGDRYRVLAPLAGAEPHTVLEAWDEWGGRPVVLLAVRSAATGSDATDGDPAAPRHGAVVTAARTAAGLRDAHLVELLDVTAGEAGAVWLVHAWGPDRSTAAALRRRHGPPSTERLARWGGQVARGLAAAHAAGLVHAAIGPGLVVVDGHDAGGGTNTAGSAALLGVAASGASSAGASSAGASSAGASSGGVGAVDDVRAVAQTLQALAADDTPTGASDPAREELRDLLVRTRGAEDTEVPTAAELADRLEALATRIVRSAPTGDGPAPPPPRPSAGAWEAGGYGEGYTVPVLTGPASQASKPAGGSPSTPARGWSAALRHRGVVVAAAVVLALALVAGTAVVTASLLGPRAATAAPSPGAPPPPSVIGDERTADPCSLTDPVPLARFGPANRVPDFGAPDTCTISVRDPGPGDVAVLLQLQTTSTDVVLGPRQQVGPFTVARDEAHVHDCGRTIVVPGGVWIAIDAVDEAGAAADVCAHAEVATQTALDALLAGKVTHRPLTVPAGSLLGTDVCGLLDAAALSRVPGVASDRVERRFGSWGCRWGATTDQNADPPVVALSDKYRTKPSFPPTTRVAGRDVAIVPDGDTNLWHACVVYLPQRTFTADNGTDRVEALQLTVYQGPQQVSADASCDRARDLVAVLATRLPPPA